MTGYRDENLEAACAGLLSLLPESCCRAEALAAACAHYGVSAAGVSRAAELLPEHYGLQYRGVRLLLGEYLREALRPFGGDVLQTSLSFKDEEELKHALFKE